MNVDEIPAGWKIDALVAERVMKLGDPEAGFYQNSFYVFNAGERRVRVPDYSTDIAAAWEVVEKLREHGHNIDISLNRLGSARVAVRHQLSDIGMLCYADTAPLAICRAALKAAEVTKA